MSKNKATAPAATEEVVPTPAEDVVVATTIPEAPATEAHATEAPATEVEAPVQSEAEQLFDQVMEESGEQLMAEVQADIAENGIPLTAEESAEIKKVADAALSEAARIRDLTPDEYEAEFGFKFLDGVSIAEQTIQKSEHVHKDRIFGLLQKIRELYVG